jgi:integrase/recombinase XerD
LTYHLKREVVGGIVNISLGLSEADAYLKFVRDRCRLNTVLSYGYDLQVFLNSIQKPVLEITPLDILTFIESQQSAYNRQGRTNGLSIKGQGLSNRTIKRRLAAVAGFYEYLSIYHNLQLKMSPIPCGLVRRKTSWGNWYGRPAATPLIRAPETQPRPLAPEELDPFINSMRCHRDRAIVLLMLLAGLRKSEVLKLTLDDIDFGQHTLTVKEGKGGHQRVVAISGTGLQELISYLNTERPPSRSERVFLVMKGRNRGLPMTVGALDTIIEYHRKKANTPGIQCHRLRHTCFTRLRQAGMSLEALQAQAGHRNITTTRMYLHLCPRELQQEYLRVSDTLFSGGTVDD